MAKLIYSVIASLDGYIEDAAGRFEWATPDEEVFGFVNELERPIGTYLYGRRMYETMRYWEDSPTDDEASAVELDFTTIWRAADKVVYSTTLDAAPTARTRLVSHLDIEALRGFKTTASADLTVGGAGLAGQLFEAGLVDELQVFVVPSIIGDGRPWFPKRVHLDLELLETRAFTSGFTYLHYRVSAPGTPPAITP